MRRMRSLHCLSTALLVLSHATACGRVGFDEVWDGGGVTDGSPSDGSPDAGPCLCADEPNADVAVCTNMSFGELQAVIDQAIIDKPSFVLPVDICLEPGIVIRNAPGAASGALTLASSDLRLYSPGVPAPIIRNERTDSVVGTETSALYVDGDNCNLENLEIEAAGEQGRGVYIRGRGAKMAAVSINTSGVLGYGVDVSGSQAQDVTITECSLRTSGSSVYIRVGGTADIDNSDLEVYGAASNAGIRLFNGSIKTMTNTTIRTLDPAHGIDLQGASSVDLMLGNTFRRSTPLQTIPGRAALHFNDSSGTTEYYIATASAEGNIACFEPSGNDWEQLVSEGGLDFVGPVVPNTSGGRGAQTFDPAKQTQWGGPCP